VRHAQITTFATCLAQASSKDANYAAAMVALEQAEREVSSCKISFPPRIAVVDRKMRVVSGRSPTHLYNRGRMSHPTAAWCFHACMRRPSVVCSTATGLMTGAFCEGWAVGRCCSSAGALLCATR